MNQLPVLAEWQMCCPGQLGAMSPAESPYDDLLPQCRDNYFRFATTNTKSRKKLSIA